MPITNPPSRSLTCPECLAPAASPGARTCAVHGLYLVTPAALAKLDEAPLLGQILDGKYALIDHLGGGGYGSVYRALQQPLGREVAIKVLHGLALNLKLGRERFEREAVSLARLGSPHTVRLIDFGITREGPIGLRNLPYMAMEVIEGEDLEQRLRRGPLPPDEVLALLEGVSDSLSEAHSVGIVHRDLKPSNILMTRTHSGRVIPKVIDFGIARVEGGNKSQTGFVTGTPAYMAPEQVRGESDLDHRVDVYALAAMTFELLTGRPPYVGADPVAILTAHCLSPIPTLRATLRDSKLWAFDSPLSRGLAKERADRPASVADFVAELQAAWARQHAAPPTSQPATTDEFDESPRTEFYGSGSDDDDTQFVERRGSASTAPSHVSPDAATAIHFATPLTISSLPEEAQSPRVAAASNSDFNKRRSVLVGVALGSTVAVVAFAVLMRRTPPAHAPAPSTVVASTVALPASAQPMPESQPAAAPSDPPVAASAPAAPVSVAAQSTPAKPRRSPHVAPPLVPDPPPPRRADDAPSGSAPDAAATRVATEVDRALDECRCGPATRLIGQLAALPKGSALAASRRARVAACVPVDVDHRCVKGRLVEVE